MYRLSVRLVGLCAFAPVWGLSSAAFAAEGPAVAPGDKEPLLRLEAGGPTSYVTALAFDRDGRTLYAAGWDKVVRSWTLNAQGKFVLDAATYRVPLGPGLNGSINAIAVSDDGAWLAVGGMGVFRGSAGFRVPGLVLPNLGALTPEMRADQGTISVFNTRTGKVRLLRAMRGTVRTLGFAPSRAGKPLLLAAVGQEWDEAANKDGGGVRLWDVDQGNDLAHLAGLPDPTGRPGLAVWHVGDGATDVRVGLSWDDGKLRVWDVRAGALKAAADARFTVTAAWAPGAADGGRLVTTSYGTGQSRLRLWKIENDGTPAVDAVAPGDGGKADVFPRALALASSKGGGAADLAAVVLRKPIERARNEYRLQLQSLAAETLAAVRADVAVWTGSAKQPALAAAPSGKYLAVGGGDRHVIHVYAIADLLAGRDTPQVLAGVGATFRSVAFVRQGKQTGVVLNPGFADVRQPAGWKGRRGDLLFSFDLPGFQADTTGWRADAPDLGEWKGTPFVDQVGAGITVSRGENLVRRVRLNRNHDLSDWALVPPADGRTVPLLAVASHDHGQPLVQLFNAVTGDTLRHLSGHVDRVYGLAFSADGRFLASTAEDQTACLWSLTNLDLTLDKLGMLPGVYLAAGAGGRPEVVKVDPDSPSNDLLRTGDRIDGRVEGGKLTPLATPRDVYEMIALLKPRSLVVLRVADANGARDVRLTVGQGVDERKPLLSLFVTAAGEWIGWNPVGPFESSGARAERYLGWHLNTGDVQEPTRFALAGEYRKQYRREGLLKELIARADLPRVPPPPAPAAPKLGLLIESQGEFPLPDARGVIPVSAPRPTLCLNVTGRPVDSLQSLRWRLDGGPEQPVPPDPSAGGDFSVPLVLKRGLHRVRLTAQTPEDGGKEFSTELNIDYQPPAPAVEFQGRPTQAVKKAEFTFHARLPADSRPGNVDLTVTHTHAGAEVARRRRTIEKTGRPLEVSEGFTLKPGRNLLEMVAVNADAPEARREAETSRVLTEVILTQKAAPPEFSLHVTGAGVTPGEVVRPGGTLTVTTPTVLLTGTVTGEANLTSAERALGDAGAASPLAGFRPDTARSLTVREGLTLRPGPQTLVVRARTSESDDAVMTAVLDYRPVLPDVAVMSPRERAVIEGDGETTDLRLDARLRPAAGAHPFTAEVLLNGTPTGTPPVVDERAGTLTAVLSLRPGDNRIRVRLHNRWGAERTTEENVVSFVRPPRVTSVERAPGGPSGSPSLVVNVRAPLPPLADSVRVEVNGAPRTPEVSVPDHPADGVWAVRLTGVPLEPGRNEITVRVATREAAAIPGRIVLDYRPEQPPPTAEFVLPRENVTVNAPRLAARVRLLSRSPFTRAEIVREGGQPLPLNVAGLRPGTDGSFRWEGETMVALAEGPNNLRLVAATADGEGSATLVANYLRRPLRLVVDWVAPHGDARELRPDVRPGGKLVFPAAPAGRLRLHGRVVWDAGEDDRLRAVRIVRVFVNGFQQMPGLLQPAPRGTRERGFDVDILLGKPADNRVEVSVPGLEMDAATCTTFSLGCEKPEHAQRLHLFMASIEEKDAKEMQSRFLRALNSETAAGGRLMTPAFGSVLTYGPLVGYYVRREYVYNQLVIIRRRIRDLANAGVPCNHVVVFYYQGGEAVGPQGNLFDTSTRRGPIDPLTAMTCDDLARFFEDTAGAHLLLFDVGRPQATPTPGGRDKLARWEDSYPEVRSHVAVLRYAYPGSTEPPGHSVMIDDLSKTLPNGERLVDVTDGLRKLTAVSGTAAGPRSFDDYLAEDLKDMLISRRRQ